MKGRGASICWKALTLPLIKGSLHGNGTLASPHFEVVHLQALGGPAAWYTSRIARKRTVGEEEEDAHRTVNEAVIVLTKALQIN